MIEHAKRRAADWLDRTYGGGLVTLTGSVPLVEGEYTWLFGCGYNAGTAGALRQPMLASTVAVPKNGAEPFPVSNADPLNERANLFGAPGHGDRHWRWRANARNCLLATDAAMDNRPASALPWQPEDEAPGWWDRLLAGSFPQAEVAVCDTWADVASAIVAGGPGTGGVVWLRRRLGDTELTGHLLYARHHDGHAIVVDGQLGTPAKLDDAEVGQLVLARFRRQATEQPGAVTAPWETPAPDLAAAVRKANEWLAKTYHGEAVLVEPSVADETRRGWLFACSTPRFLAGGDWRAQLLDAAVVVPKAAGEAPFGLPNPDPWTWFSGWDAGETGLPDPPAAGSADWLGRTMTELGSVLSENVHQDWGGVFYEVAGYPINSRALVWLRRRDRRGRETVGNLLLAANEPDGIKLIDSTSAGGRPVLEPEPLGLHVIRFA